MINVDFILPEASPVRLLIKEMTGRNVIDLSDDTSLEAGSHTRQVDVTPLSNGIYFITLESRNARKDKVYKKIA